MKEAADFLIKLADTLDAWAEESRRGGWSTHQVNQNRNEATRCRTMAAQLYRTYNQ